MFILTSLDGHSIYKEVEQFLYKTDCILLKRILVSLISDNSISLILLSSKSIQF